jgi:hypothetical protein
MNYKIYKNSHYSWILGFLKPIGISTQHIFKYKIKFDKNCLYTINNIDQWDINKLVGFSGSYSHHIQSCRVGWRCLDGENIQLVTYCYDNKVRLPEVIISDVKPDEEFTITLKNSQKNWTFIFYQEGKGRKVININKKSSGWFLKYLLFPYFGGNQKALHNMSIYIKESGG